MPSEGGLAPPSGPPPPGGTGAGGDGARTNAEWIFQRCDKGSYLFYQSRGAGVLLDFSDDGGADNHAVGDGADGGDLVGGGDTEANADGLGGDHTQRADLGGEVFGKVAALAGDAGQRDEIDEASRQARDGPDAPGGRGRRHELDDVEARGFGLRAQRLGLLPRQGGHQHARGAPRPGRGG